MDYSPSQDLELVEMVWDDGPEERETSGSPVKRVSLVDDLNDDILILDDHPDELAGLSILDLIDIGTLVPDDWRGGDQDFESDMDTEDDPGQQLRSKIDDVEISTKEPHPCIGASLGPDVQPLGYRPVSMPCARCAIKTTELFRFRSGKGLQSFWKPSRRSSKYHCQ